MRNYNPDVRYSEGFAWKPCKTGQEEGTGKEMLAILGSRGCVGYLHSMYGLCLLSISVLDDLPWQSVEVWLRG